MRFALQGLLVLTVLLAAPFARAFDCAKDGEPIAFATKEIGVHQGQSLTFSGVKGELQKVKPPLDTCKMEADAYKALQNIKAEANETATWTAPETGGCVQYKNADSTATVTIRVDAKCAKPDTTHPSKPEEEEEEEEEEKQKPEKKTPICAFGLGEPDRKAIIADHKCGEITGKSLNLCLGPSGEIIGKEPAFEEGMRVNVLLFGRASASGTFTLEVSFERTLLVNQADLKGLRLFSDPFVVKTQREISLSAGGKLKITVKRGAGKYDGTDAQDKSPLPQGCSYEAATIPLTFDVVGHYHFSAGVMVSYTRLTDRTFSRQTGDDGVVRIGQQSSPGVDYIANVVGYPFGVDENKDPLAVGILFGTSLSDLGKRWYGGLEIASPIGLGLSGGVAVVVVPRLDEPLLVGQPFSGDQLATHDAAEPTWYLGINLQAELFKTAFGALFSKGED